MVVCSVQREGHVRLCAVECNVHREGLGIIGSVRLSATLRGWGSFQREGLDMFSLPMQETRSLYYR